MLTIREKAMASTVSRLQEPKMAVWFVSAFLLTFGLPLAIDISLIILLTGTVVASHYHVLRHADRSIVLSALFFIITVVACSLLSNNVEESFLYSASFVPGILLFILLGQSKEMSDWHLVILSLLFSLVLQVAYIFVSYLLSSTESLLPAEIIEQSGSLVFIVPNDIVLLSLLIPFCLYFIRYHNSGLVRVFSGIMIVTTVMCGLWLQSRTAILVAGVSLLSYLLLSLRRIPWHWVFISIVVVLLVDTAAEFGLVDKVLSFNDSRLPLWRAGWQMFLTEPMTGFGPHTYGEFYREFFSGEGMPGNVIVDTRHTPWPHNLYIELLAEYGILGLISFLLVVAAVVRTLHRKLYAEKITPVAKFQMAAFSSFIGFLLAALVELTFLRMWVVLYLSLLLAIFAFSLDLSTSVHHKRSSQQFRLKYALGKGKKNEKYNAI